MAEAVMHRGAKESQKRQEETTIKTQVLFAYTFYRITIISFPFTHVITKEHKIES